MLKSRSLTIHLSAVFILALVSVMVMADALAQKGRMLYLVEFKATEAGAPMSREQSIELLQNLIVPSLQTLANLEKEGRILGGGVFVGERAAAFIMAAESHEEVTKVVRALPAWGVWEWHITPLETFAYRAALESKVVEDLRKGK